MRRKEREISDTKKIIEIISKCSVLRLAMSENNMPYVIPLNFGYSCENDVFEFYIHCAKEGKKLDIIAKNPTVCFEMDCSHELIVAKKACGYSYRFKSIIGMGEAKLVEDIEQKKLYLTRIMKHQADKDFSFSNAEVSSVEIIKIVASSISGKAN